jgi:hypothetical protein
MILADHDNDPRGICRHGAAGFHTISGYIVEPAAGVLHVRRGHGCLGTWHAYEIYPVPDMRWLASSAWFLTVVTTPMAISQVSCPG